MGAPLFAVCLKPVELWAGVDPLSGRAERDLLSLGLSPADEAALEWALTSAERHGGRVRALAAGDSGAEAVLRTAAAAGADDLCHVVCDPEWPSEWVAASLAKNLGDVLLVFCGDLSLDRGSGSVPAFLAAALGWSQALGLVDLALPSSPAEPFEVLRRLEGGRRERLFVKGPAVLSVEGSTARLRRAALGPVISARRGELPIARIEGRPGSTPAPRTGPVGPYRPPTKVVAPPAGETAGERVRSLVGLGARSSRAGAVALEPAAAAAMIIESLEKWGEL